MKLQRPARRKAQDPTIALINIVFLMLIFFLLAGTIAPGGIPDIELIRTSEAERSRPPAEPIGLTATGEIRYGGEPVSAEQLIERLSATAAAPVDSAATGMADGEAGEAAELDLVADKALPASQLIAFLRTLREAGYSARIVTRSGGSL